jgi:hypothetical protein
MKGEEVTVPEKAPDLLEPEAVEEPAKVEQISDDQTQKWLDEQNKKFEQEQKDSLEKAQYELQDKKNTVLEQQIQDSKNIGQTFSNRLKQYGADGDEINRYMDDLKFKMQDVENLMHEDEDRQNDILRMRLDQRRNRRKKLTEKLGDLEQIINETKAETAQLQDEKLAEIQEVMNQELDEV